MRSLHTTINTAVAACERFFFAPVPSARLGAFRALVCGVALYDVLLYANVVWNDAAAVSAGTIARPWTPLYLFSLLGVGPMGTDTAKVIFWGAVLSLGCGALGLFSRVSCLLGAVAFYAWTGYAYSFGKPHHDKIALAFALAALPFARVGLAVSLDAVLARWRGRERTPLTSGMPIRLCMVTLAIGYCGAGSAKLLLGGVDWFNGYTLQGIMLGHDGEWSRFFAANVRVCQLLSASVVAVQATFPLVFFVPKLRWFYLPAATSFHLMTWKTMDTGPYMRVWLLLPAFVPLEQVPATLRDWLRKGPAPALLTALACGALLWLVGSVMSIVVPTWLLLAVLTLLLGGFAWHCRAASRRTPR